LPLPRFRIEAPTTPDEAVALLDDHGDAAAVYAGGTELLLAMKAGFLSVDRLVDIKGIRELREIRAGSGRVEIGATATYRRIEGAPEVRRGVPSLVELVRDIANVRVRSVGTLVGNLCFAEPHSDPAVLLWALDAEMICRGPRGDRRVPVADFIVSPYESALASAEVATTLEVPLPGPSSAVGFERFRIFERPTANAAVRLDLDGQGWVQRAVVVVGAAGPVPARVPSAEAVLEGTGPDDVPGVMAAVRDAVREEVDPMEDGYGTQDFKRHLSGEMATRALARAAGTTGRAGG